MGQHMPTAPPWKQRRVANLVIAEDADVPKENSRAVSQRCSRFVRGHSAIISHGQEGLIERSLSTPSYAA